jgi:hypothetical protein
MTARLWSSTICSNTTTSGGCAVSTNTYSYGIRRAWVELHGWEVQYTTTTSTTSHIHASAASTTNNQHFKRTIV